MVFLLALSLGIDVFAVSASYSMSVPEFRKKQALSLAVCFGLFHTGMTAIGSLAGYHFLGQLDFTGRIVSFSLLALVGGNMIREALRKGEEADDICTLRPLRMLTLSIATSVDTLAIGVSIGLGAVDLIFACVVIGLVAFAMTLGGAFLGERVGCKFREHAGVIGGLVLIGLGVRSLFG